MALQYRTRPTDLIIHQKVLRNAYETLETDEYPITGKLCDDIASLGYAEGLVIDDIFRPRRAVLETRLAARVCESCIFWTDCDRLVKGDLPIDFEDRFSIERTPNLVEDNEVMTLITKLMRQRDFGILESA